MSQSAAGRLKKKLETKNLVKKKSPYSKRTFRKEVNAIARRAGKNGDIKLVEKAIKREQGKHGKKENKHKEAVTVHKSLSLVTQTPLMSPLTLWNRVKGFLAKRDMSSVLSD
jgi:hypothetical protein